MFICQKCNKLTDPGKPQNKIVVETREKEYFERNKYGKLEVIGKGFEIVKEINVCENCYLKHRKNTK